jgi:hypothetical protein
VLPILDRTSQLQDAVRTHMPAQPAIPFTAMFENIIGVPDMAGAGLNIQASGRPASDLLFRHKKATAVLDPQTQKEKKQNFTKVDNRTKVKVNTAYKRIVAFALKYLSEEHQRVLRTRVPNYELMLAFYEQLMDDRIVSSQAASQQEVIELDQADPHAASAPAESAQPQRKKSRHSERWYTNDDITDLLRLKLADPRFGFVTPLIVTDAFDAADFEAHVADYIREFVERSDEPDFWVFVPFNVNQSHWTLVAIRCDPLASQAQAFYFDPLTDTIDASVERSITTALQQVFPGMRLGPYQALNVQVQTDSHNCGPWIVEAAEQLATQGTLENLIATDINQVRVQHHRLLREARRR